MKALIRICALTAFLSIEAFNNPLRTPKGDFLRRRSIMMATVMNPPVSAETCDPLITPVFADKCDVTGITLTRYLLEFSRANPHLKEIESLMTGIQTACKAISHLVNRASITGTTGFEDGDIINVQGEQQKKLDVLTNQVLKDALRFTNQVSVLASEEETVPVYVRDNREQYAEAYASRRSRRTTEVVMEGGSKPLEVSVTCSPPLRCLSDVSPQYVAVFDPLDGSANVDASIPVGTIFGIFAAESSECLLDEDMLDKDPASQMAQCLTSTLQPSKNLVAAGYCLYSSSTQLVFTLGCQVNVFTYDPTIGEFILTTPDLQIPRRGKIYSFNEAMRWDWDTPLQQYITALQLGQGQSGQRYSSRYIGSMCADVHRTMLYGGIFGYPATKANPDGKLRLLYEAGPMAFLLEHAGGKALTGKNRILDLRPKTVHQRVPCILGSPEDVEECRSFYEASKDPELIKRCSARLG